jgi:hypothetical protein
MPSGNSGLGVNVEGLRERLPHQLEAPVKAENVNAAQDAVKVLNEQQASEGKDEKDKKTFGRTPDGTGAYKKPFFNGCRAEHEWDSKYTVASETSPPNPARSPALFHPPPSS